MKKSRLPQLWLVSVLGGSFLALAGSVQAAEWDKPGWNLVFNDEFDELSLDTASWHTCFWWATDTCSIETNQELELYNPADVFVENGRLRLRAQRRDMVGWNGQLYNYTSGMVMTGGRKYVKPFFFQYGYAEAQVKVPSGRGLWPAFWLLPVDCSNSPCDYTSRPEIDVMEILGQEPNVQHMNYHFLYPNGSSGDVGTSRAGPDFSAGWHTFGIEWSPTALVWYVDDVEWWRYTDPTTIASNTLYLILNLAVGGNWPGPPDPSTVFPSYFEVEYVRVYQRALASPTPALPGDLDYDSDVDYLDFGGLVRVYGSEGCGQPADLTGDCRVDLFDFGQFVVGYGQ